MLSSSDSPPATPEPPLHDCRRPRRHMPVTRADLHSYNFALGIGYLTTLVIPGLIAYSVVALAYGFTLWCEFRDQRHLHPAHVVLTVVYSSTLVLYPTAGLSVASAGYAFEAFWRLRDTHSPDQSPDPGSATPGGLRGPPR